MDTSRVLQEIVPDLSEPNVFLKVRHEHDTPETVYKVPICPRGNLLYKQIYLITDQKWV